MFPTSVPDPDGTLVGRKVSEKIFKFKAGTGLERKFNFLLTLIEIFIHIIEQIF
jgi:hypothetical protein